MLKIQTTLQIFLQNADVWVIIDKWKSNINGRPRWKPIRNLSHQYFIKIL